MEEAESHADMLVRGFLPLGRSAPRRDEGLAKLLEHMRRETRTVIAMTMVTASFDHRASTSTLLAAKSMAFSTELRCS